MFMDNGENQDIYIVAKWYYLQFCVAHRTSHVSSMSCSISRLHVEYVYDRVLCHHGRKRNITFLLLINHIYYYLSIVICISIVFFYIK